MPTKGDGRRGRPAARARPYHHGNLRAELIRAALDHITRSGPATLSLRELARQAGVSHAAPARHFGDKTGVFTAIATEGFRLLAGANRAPEEPNPLGAAGLAYLRFAIDHPAHFTIMNRPDLYDPDDPALVEARRAAEQGFLAGAADLTADEERRRLVALAARSVMHGFITLWLSGSLSEYGDDPEEVAFLLGLGLAQLGEAAHALMAGLPVSSLAEYRAFLGAVNGGSSAAPTRPGGSPRGGPASARS
jgi:AcrR family transcriptional regulator